MSGIWLTRVKREHAAGNLTHAARLVLEQLDGYFGRRREAWPSHATLAERTGCCVKTVQRALQAARDLGLVRWTERRVRAAWRSLRTSNVYRLLLPEGPVQSRAEAAFTTTGQKVRGEESKHKEEAREGGRAALSAMLAAAERLPDLAAVRQWRMRALGLA